MEKMKKLMFELFLYLVNAEVVLKATNVDGVYDDDPKCNPNARLLHTLTYQDVTSKELSVMDMTAITLCQENNIPGKPPFHETSLSKHEVENFSAGLDDMSSQKNMATFTFVLKLKYHLVHFTH